MDNVEVFFLKRDNHPKLYDFEGHYMEKIIPFHPK